MAENQQSPQCLVEEYRCPTGMVVLSRCPANDDGYPVVDGGISARNDECLIRYDGYPMTDDGWPADTVNDW